MTAKTANVNPKNVLPTSPMKIFAGGQLKAKNPRVDATKDIETIYTNTLPWLNDIYDKKAAAITAVVAAMPSSHP